MDILVIGSGYVGLVSAVCFAEMGHTVISLDIDANKIKNLQKGIIPIYEPGLDEYIKRNARAKRLSFTTDYKSSIEKSQVIFIAVSTPSNEDGSCNLNYVFDVARSTAAHMDGYKVIVIKSTVAVGTGFKIKEKITQELKKRNKEIDFDVVSNPEFLKEGSAIFDALKPDRIVIGTDSKKASDLLIEIYKSFTVRQDRILVMDILSAELTKYAANAMLATRISFMNEIASICTKLGADVNQVRKGIGSDSRIGYSFLYPGIGYGGSCFPKDIKALIHTAKEAGIEPSLLQVVESINLRQKEILAEKIERFFEKKGGVNGKTIAIWGLSFKPQTDDMREAPSITLIEKLLKKGAILKLYDPVAMDNAKKLFKGKKNLHFCQSEQEAASSADAIALLTEWKQFRVLDFNPIIKNMNTKAFFDGRNQYSSQDMERKGFKYFAIGIPEND